MDSIEPLQSPPTIFNYDSMNEGKEEEKEEEKKRKGEKGGRRNENEPPKFYILDSPLERKS